MTLIQKRMRDKLQTKDSKLEVLLMQWDKTVRSLIKRNKRKKGGGKLNDFIDQMRLINNDVKRACMAEYLRKVQTKYSAAFSQWRYMLEFTNKEEIIGNMESISRYFFRDIDISKLPIEKTLKASKIPIEVEESYDLIMTDRKLIQKQPYLIHTFWSIGMADPFPDESTMFEDTTNKFIGPDPFYPEFLVYPENRFSLT